MIDYTIITSSLAGLDFLGKFARAIIEGVGLIGLGIIVFTLVLKGITLPFDVYQRYKTRKQTLIMRGMKDDLDKLQKQYANDKTTYNQKMMELYKKNGYSMFGACLPMILSLVILIVAFQGFNSYSRYANVKQFVDMTGEFNAAVLGHGTDGIDYHLPIEGVENDGTVITIDIENKAEWSKEEAFTEEGGTSYNVKYEVVYGEDGTLPIQDENGNLIREVPNETVRIRVTSDKEGAYLHYTYLICSYTYTYDAAEGRVIGTPVHIAKEDIHRDYYIDLDEFKTYLEGVAESDTLAASTLTAINEDLNANEGELTAAGKAVCTSYVDKLGAIAAREYYLNHKMGFLWIKNVWESDATYRHPVPQSTPNKKAIAAGDYARLTSELTDQQKAYNGYYILIILSIGTMILSQVVTMRSQKEANKYQTADGQGAKTQKFMLFLMPILFGVFAFMYSAAFSIYMIISSVVSLLVTLLCNLILGRVFKKKENAAIQEKYGRKLAWKDKDEKQKKSKTKSRK